MTRNRVKTPQEKTQLGQRLFYNNDNDDDDNNNNNNNNNKRVGLLHKCRFLLVN
jgi:hypothetical protein